MCVDPVCIGEVNVRAGDQADGLARINKMSGSPRSTIAILIRADGADLRRGSEIASSTWVSTHAVERIRS